MNIMQLTDQRLIELARRCMWNSLLECCSLYTCVVLKMSDIALPLDPFGFHVSPGPNLTWAFWMRSRKKLEKAVDRATRQAVWLVLLADLTLLGESGWFLWARLGGYGPLDVDCVS